MLHMHLKANNKKILFVFTVWSDQQESFDSFRGRGGQSGAVHLPGLLPASFQPPSSHSRFRAACPTFLISNDNNIIACNFPQFAANDFKCN